VNKETPVDLKKIFRGRNRRGAPVKAGNVRTAPLADQQLHDALVKGKAFTPRQLLAACGQSVGKQREHNEDSLVAFSITLGIEPNSIPLGLYIVADGMGGYQYGEVASEAAVRSVTGNILRKFLAYIANPSEPMEESLQELLRGALGEAQRIVLQAAPGGGTTLTAALVLGAQVTVAHVGDSRAYILRPDRRIEPLTRDHTLVKRLEELGQITAQEASTHPQRNVLYRALGQGEALDPDIFTAPFPQPGYVLLCSDGLWGVVPEADICQIVYESPDMQTACQNLLQAANSAGGPDNISVILVQLLG
jgi:serine/threonine protein phosphatase PrpC